MRLDRSGNVEISPKKLVGYTDRLSVVQGEEISFMVSCAEETYEASIVWLGSRDRRPFNEHFKEREVETAVSGRYAGRIQPVSAGSYGTADCGSAQSLSSISIVMAVWPTTPRKERQLLFEARSGTQEANAISLLLDRGRVVMRLAHGDGTTDEVACEGLLREREWYLVSAVYDSDANRLGLTVKTIGRHRVASEVFEAVRPAARRWTLAPHAVYVAGRPDAQTLVSHFNGKIDSPRIHAGALASDVLNELLIDPLRHESSLFAAWDFSDGIESTGASDLSRNGRNIEFVNMPTRAMIGWNWDGTEMNWRRDRAQYGAVHFHDDDLYDAGWTADFAFRVPADLPSGVYAARLRCEGDTTYLPFFVRPGPDAAKSRVAVLFPTASYIAYANQHGVFDDADNEVMSGFLPCLRETDLFLDLHREYGCGLYDSHSDGSGVCYSSRLRPIVNMHPGLTASWCGPGGNFPWAFGADLDIVDWLDAMAIGFDAITDEDLHAEGVDLLVDYDVVITGTHPEYTSTAMWDALHRYTHEGGSLMYLGGNGFYWRTAFHKQLPGIIEVRRTEDGVRNWCSEPGEYYHAFTDEYGGLWRRLGRPPQMLVGVGFSGQGFDLSSSYRRISSCSGSDTEFIFEGIDEDEIGGFGSIGGGAAGLEIDRYDRSLGSPWHAKVVATSLGKHRGSMFPCPSEVNMVSYAIGGDLNPKVRADMVFFDTERGGSVFSVGSIAYAGSLADNGYQNNISRLTRNVIDHFLRPKHG